MNLRKVVIRFREKGGSAAEWGYKAAKKLESKGIAAVVESSAVGRGQSAACDADLVVVVGGDGTLLRLIDLCGGSPPPVLGFAAESLGYLLPHSVETLEVVLEKAMAGECEVRRVRLGEYSSQAITGYFLNEVGLWAPRGKLIEFTMRVGGFFYKARSDGVIVSTSAGSTAHALSYGASIIVNFDEPILEAVFPGALSPLVKPLIAYNKSMEILLSQNSETAHLIVDGRYVADLPPGSEVKVSPSQKNLELVTVESYAVDLARKLYLRLIDMGRWQGSLNVSR
ncbi:MAG: NAD(+)/NADH kinase [Thermofilum sp.]